MTDLTDVVLGSTYRDSISSFEGTAIGITVWQWGCVTVGLAPTSLGAEDKVRETEWFDESRLVLIDAKLNAPTGFTGGPENMGPGEVNR